MSPLALLGGVVHGLGLISLAAVIGGLSVDRMILPAGVALTASRHRLRRAITGLLVLLLVLTVADLLVRTRAMSGGAPTGILAALHDVLGRTHFGAIWMVRAIVLGLVLILSRSRGDMARALCALCTLALALTATLTGHAAEWGDLTASVAVDWAHAMAASAWTGGLIVLALLVPGREAGWPPALLGAVARRFSRLAAACLLIVVLTGVYNAWAQLGAVSALWTSTYGRVLVGKLLLAAVLVWLGAINRYMIVPRLLAARSPRGLGARFVRASRFMILGRIRLAGATVSIRFSRYLVREAILVVAVFAATAALGEATPGRHAQLPRKLTTHVSAKEWRQSIDVGKVSGFTLPPGSSVRGREVFLKLQCFDCHATPDERFPSPRRPGPDLAGASRAHPAYLAESIVNPNALVVDGPGYSAPDGTSTMPDSGDGLTVAELIDLVTYLKTFGRD